MTSQTGQQIITILPNISNSKRYQAMAFGQLIKNSVRNIFLQFFLLFKASGQHLSFDIFSWTLTWTYHKNKLYNISDCWYRDKIIKGSRTSFPTSFCAWYFKKSFLMLYSINWPIFIFLLSLLLEILGNMCIVCCSVCDVINFKIDHTFLSTRFST